MLAAYIGTDGRHQVSARHAEKARDEGDDFARHYVNALSTRISLSSIDFDLAALGAEAEGKDRVWRFVTTPSRFQSFHTRLGQAIDSYCTQFGEIASPEADDAGAGWAGDRG